MVYAVVHVFSKMVPSFAFAYDDFKISKTVCGQIYQSFIAS